jgi:uncharacterized protein (DUF427 family)
MKRFEILPEYKKCTYEVQTFVKEDKKITVTTQWRYAKFSCESENPPVIAQLVDLYETVDNLTFEEASDGDCFYDYENMSEEEIDTMDEWFGDNSYLDLEEDGWIPSDCVWYFDCPVEITEIV